MNSRSAAASTRSRQHAAWTLGRWIAAGALEQADIEDELYMAADAALADAVAGRRPLQVAI